MNRRTFLGASMASAAAFAQGGKRLPIKKALYISMLGKDGSYAERFQRARDAGFDEIECATVESQSEAEEIKKAAEQDQAADSFGDESGALEISAVLERSEPSSTRA